MSGWGEGFEEELGSEPATSNEAPPLAPVAEGPLGPIGADTSQGWWVDFLLKFGQARRETRGRQKRALRIGSACTGLVPERAVCEARLFAALLPICRVS